MTLTTDDLTAIDVRTKSAIEKALIKNNRILKTEMRQEMAEMLVENNTVLKEEIVNQVRQDMSEMLAENNKIIIDGLTKYVKETSEVDSVKKQLRNHQHRIEKIEATLQS